MTKETENIHEAGTSITDRRICWIQTAHGDGWVKAWLTIDLYNNGYIICNHERK